MGALTDMLLPDKGSSEEGENENQAEEGEPLPRTPQHGEFYPKWVEKILQVLVGSFQYLYDGFSCYVLF